MVEKSRVRPAYADHPATTADAPAGHFRAMCCATLLSLSTTFFTPAHPQIVFLAKQKRQNCRLIISATCVGAEDDTREGTTAMNCGHAETATSDRHEL